MDNEIKTIVLKNGDTLFVVTEDDTNSGIYIICDNNVVKVHLT